MRKISWPLYIAAFLITVGIFLIGFYFASIAQRDVELTLSEKIERFNQESTLIQILEMTKYDKNFCPLYNKALLNSYSEIDEIGRELTYIEEIKGERNIELKKEYFLFELKTLLLAEKVNDICNNNQQLVIYFYSKECEECKEIGTKLSRKREKNKNIKVFSFEDGIGSEVVESLKKKYNITSIPSIVVNGVVNNEFVE